jgi:hypothetical protein
MTGLNHALTGAAIGAVLQQPLLIVPLAVASHFILDMIPHFDHEVYRYGGKYYRQIVTTDGLITIGAILALMFAFPAYALFIALGAISAVAPDIPWQYYYTHGRPKNWYFNFHTKIQWFERPPGLLVEASYLVFIGTVLFALF